MLVKSFSRLSELPKLGIVGEGISAEFTEDNRTSM